MLLNTLSLSHPKIRQFVANNKIARETAHLLHAHHLPIFDCEHYCALIEKQPYPVCFEVLIELTKHDCALLLRDDIIEFTRNEHLDMNTIFRSLKSKLIDKFGVPLTHLFLSDAVTYADLCALVQNKPSDFAIIKKHAYFCSWIENHLCTIQDVLKQGLLSVTIHVYALRLYGLYQNYLKSIIETDDTLDNIQYELKTITEYHAAANTDLNEQLTHALLLLFKSSIEPKQGNNPSLCSLQEKCIEIIDTCVENDWGNTLDELIYLAFSAKMNPCKETNISKKPQQAFHSLYQQMKKKKEDNVSIIYSSLIKLKSLLPVTLSGN